MTMKASSGKSDRSRAETSKLWTTRFILVTQFMRISKATASELRLNRHDAPCAFYLEPEVLSCFDRVLQTGVHNLRITDAQR
jgi:hypothetical protein